MKIIKMIRPRGKMFLNPGIKSTTKLIKNKCRVRLAKQRSMIRTKKSNLLIDSSVGSKSLNSKDPNGPLTNKRESNYPFIPVKLYLLFTKGKEWIRFASHKKEAQSSIPAKPSALINKSALVNRVTYLKVNYPFIPVEYIATNKTSNTMEEKSIYRVDRSTLVGAYLFQKKDLKKSHFSNRSSR
jgi:hypothetical protein